MGFVIDKLYEELLRNISLIELLQVVVGALILCKRDYFKNMRSFSRHLFSGQTAVIEILSRVGSF